MKPRLKFRIALVASVVIAYLAWLLPQCQMPIIYDFTISRSLPLAVVWILLVVFALWRYRKKGLWLLVGSPMALYWPIWLLFHRFPPCYYAHNCV